MPTVTNTTDKEVCIRTGRDHTEYRFYFIRPHGEYKVSKEEAEVIAKRIEEVKIVGVTVSGLIEEPLEVVNKQEEEVPPSVEVVGTEPEELSKGGSEPIF